jgi:hypothetical protein
MNVHDHKNIVHKRANARARPRGWLGGWIRGCALAPQQSSDIDLLEFRHRDTPAK